MYDDVQLGWLAGDDYERAEPLRGQHEPTEDGADEVTDDEAHPKVLPLTKVLDDLYRRRRVNGVAPTAPTAPRPRGRR